MLKFPRYLAQILFGVVVLACYLRLFFGLDFLDEGSHVAYSHTLYNGRIPFLEELDIRQTMALVLAPLVSVYESLFSSNYLVLFLRHISFLGAVVGALFVRSLHRYFPPISCLMAAALLVAFVPYSLLSFNYLRHPFLGFVVSACLLMHSLQQTDRWILPILAIPFILGICVIHPLWAIPSIVMVSIYFRRLNLRLSASQFRRSVAVTLGFATFAAAAIFIILFPMVSAGNLTSIWSYHKFIGHAGTVSKLAAILSGFRFFGRFFIFSILAVLIFLSAVRIRRPILCVLALPFLVLPFRQGWNTYLGAIPCLWVLLFGSISAIALPCLTQPEGRESRDLVWLVCPASLIAAIMTGWSSSTPLTSIAIGLVPATVVGILVWPQILNHQLRLSGRSMSVLAGCVLVLFVYCHLAFIPLDARYSQLTERFESGPFAGIQTSLENKKFINELKSDLESIGANETIAIFYDFPAGYLLTDAKPRSPSICLLDSRFLQDPKSYVDIIARYYKNDNELPSILIQMKRVPLLRGEFSRVFYRGSDSFITRLGLGKRYRLSAHTDNYRIWSRSIE